MQENLRRKFEAERRATATKSLEETSHFGMNSDVVGQLFAHWRFKYKYRRRANELNKLNHYKTNVQGIDIHFIRVKPENTKNIKVSSRYPLSSSRNYFKGQYHILHDKSFTA